MKMAVDLILSDSLFPKISLFWINPQFSFTKKPSVNTNIFLTLNNLNIWIIHNKHCSKCQMSTLRLD